MFAEEAKFVPKKNVPTMTTVKHGGFVFLRKSDQIHFVREMVNTENGFSQWDRQFFLMILLLVSVQNRQDILHLVHETRIFPITKKINFAEGKKS